MNQWNMKYADKKLKRIITVCSKFSLRSQFCTKKRHLVIAIKTKSFMRIYIFIKQRINFYKITVF